MPIPLLAAAAKAAAPMLKKAAAKAVKRKAVSTAQKAVSKKKYRKGGKVGDPKKKKKDDKSFTTLREAPSRRPTMAEFKQATGRGPGGKEFLAKLPSVIEKRVEQEKRRPASGKPAKKGMKVKKYNKGGKGDPKKAFSSKSEAAKAKLEAQIEKAKGTPAAKPLVKKYRSMFKAMKGAKVKKYAAGGGPMDPTLDPTDKSNAPALSGDPFSNPIAKASSAKAVTESADEAKVPAGGGKGKKGLKKAGEIIGKQRANYDKRRATGGGTAARSSMMSYKKGGKAKKFPDLTGDGKVTMADILKGRGVVAKNGMKVKKRKKVVAKGADRADVRGDRKAARINKRLKRKS